LAVGKGVKTSWQLAVGKGKNKRTEKQKNEETPKSDSKAAVDRYTTTVGNNKGRLNKQIVPSHSQRFISIY
jgi:hypothetical protein